MRYQTYIKKFKTILVQFIDKIDIKHTNKGRPRKFKTDFYVKYIIQVLINGIAWNKLNLEDIYGNVYCIHSAIYKMSNAYRHLATLGSLTLAQYKY
jgi:hypothetical protein